MKKLNNKGFSLVELIIVIAIMVILVAVLSPVFSKYVERSRKSTDVQSASNLASVFQAENVDPFRTTALPSGKVDAAYISANNLGDVLSSAPVVKSKDSGAKTGEFFYVEINGNEIKIHAGNAATDPEVFPNQAAPYNN